MVPADTRLRSARKIHLNVSNAYGDADLRWNRHPSLVYKRDSARCEPRRPDRFDGVGAFFKIQSSRRNSQELVVDNSEEITWCEAICRRDDVCLPPTDKLLSKFKRQRSPVICRTEPAQFTEWPPNLPIQPGHLETALNL